MTVTLGVYGATGASGWSTFTQDGGGSRIYVSSSGGNDSNSGLTPALAKQNLQGVNGAVAAFNALTNYRDNWLMLKKGDTWTDFFGNTPMSGKNSQQPVMFTSYDPAFVDGSGNPIPNPYGSTLARPIVKVANGSIPIGTAAGGVNGSGGAFIVLNGIDFYAYQNDPDMAGSYLQTAAPTGGLFSNAIIWGLVEDCCWRNFIEGLQPTYFDTLIVRRCNIRNCLGAPGSFFGNQGILIGPQPGYTNNFTMEECTWDHNGWSESSYFAGFGGTPAASVTITGSPGNAVVNWTGNNLKVGDQIYFSSLTGGTGLAINTEYYVLGTGNSFNISASSGGSPLTISANYSAASLVWTMTGIAEREFNHNIYLGDIQPSGVSNYGHWNSGATWHPVVQGNIFARGCIGDNLRTACIFQNNFYVQSPIPFSLLSPGTDAADVSDNVFAQAANVLYNTTSYGWGLASSSVYNDDYQNRSSGYAIHDNIFTNTEAGRSFGVQLAGGANNYNVYSNIVSNWGGDTSFTSVTGAILTLSSIGGTFVNATGAPDALGSISGTYAAAVGGVVSVGAVTFSGGTPADGSYAFTDSATLSTLGLLVVNGGSGTIRITFEGSASKIGDNLSAQVNLPGGINFTAPVTNIIVRNVTLSGGSGSGAQCDITLNASSNVTKAVPSGTLPGDASTPTNPGYKVNDSLSGTLGGTGFTVSVTQLLVRGVALSGGSGDGNATMNCITNASGSVIATYINGNPFFQTESQFGVGYHVGDSLSGTMGGNAFSVSVTQLATNTFTGNTANGTGGPYPDATRTISSYIRYIGLGSTNADFYNAVDAQFKGNWNPALTADAINDYFQEGFGIFETPQTVLLGQIMM